MFAFPRGVGGCVWMTGVGEGGGDEYKTFFFVLEASPNQSQQRKGARPFVTPIVPSYLAATPFSSITIWVVKCYVILTNELMRTCTVYECLPDMLHQP